MSVILLLLEHKENRRLMRELLSQSYEVLEARSIETLDESFDLGIVDGLALDRHWESIHGRRQAEGATFLPFLLVTSRQDVSLMTRHLWRVVDELIVAPIERIEMLARVETLLRSRRFSLESESKYYTLAENAPVGIYLARDGELLYANSTLFGIVRRTWTWEGFDAEPGRRRHLIEWLAQQPPSLRPRRVQLPTPEGSCCLDVITSEVLHQGEPTVMGIVTDLSERIAIEEGAPDDA